MPPQTAAHLPAETRSGRLDQAVRALLAATPELEAAAVVSFDGLPMAAALPPPMEEDRVAAMSAALLSLGERAAAGLGRGELSQVYIEGDAGTVFLVSAEDEAVLVAVASKGAKTGMMLYEVRRAAAVVAEVLRAQDAVQEQPATAVLHAVSSGVGAVEALAPPSGPPSVPQQAEAPAPAPVPPLPSGWTLPPAPGSLTPGSLAPGSLLPGEPPRWS